MAAVIVPESVAPAPWHRPVRGHRPPAARPHLRVLPGGPSAVRAARRGVRRPGPGAVVTGVAVAMVVALALVGLAHLLGADAADSGPASTAAVAPAPSAAVVAGPTAGPAGVAATASQVVVRPGDTLWSIARSLQPTGDVRPLVDRLAERAGGARLVVGQRLDISGVR